MIDIRERLEAEMDAIPVEVEAGRRAVARRVTRRRRRRVGLATLVVLAILAVAVVALRPTGDADQPVVTGPGTTEVPAPASTTPTTSGPFVDHSAITVLPGTTDLVDGQLVTVQGAGFTSGETGIAIWMCDGPSWSEDCDGPRARTTQAADDGTFTLDLRVFREIYNPRGWRTCDPCVLRATRLNGAGALTSDDVVLTFAAGRPAPRPSLSIVGHADGVLHVGESITVEGSGFQIDDDVSIGFCPPGESGAGCMFLLWGFTRSDGDGNMRATGVVDLEHLTPCLPPASCVLAVNGQIGMRSVVEVPITVALP